MSAGATPSPQTDLSSRLGRRPLTLEDFELPGLGDPGPYCGTDTLPDTNAICPTGDAARYEPRRCRLVECPDCYRSEDREQAFKHAVELEAIARDRDERPHALVWSVPPSEGSSFSTRDLNLKLMSRGRRRFWRGETDRHRCEAFDHLIDECPDCYTERIRCDDVGTRGHDVDGCPDCQTDRYRCEDDDHLIDECPDCYDIPPSFIGGIGVVHPARLLDDVQDQLRALGYGARGSKGGLWDGVREDALDLGDWREYAEYSPHGHNIGFPGWIEEHSHDDFIVRKYDQLEDVGAVVAHLRYLMGHRGVYSGSGTFRSIRPWGALHHATEDWDGAEQELEKAAYERVCADVAGEMGGEWSDEKGLHYPDEEVHSCPSCGTPRREFIDLWDLPELAKSSNQGGEAWINRLSDSQYAFVMELIEILMSGSVGFIKRDDLEHPDDLVEWVDPDRPPP